MYEELEHINLSSLRSIYFIADFKNILEKVLENEISADVDLVLRIGSKYIIESEFENFILLMNKVGINNFSINNSIFLRVFLANSDRFKKSFDHIVEFLNYLLVNGADVGAEDNISIKIITQIGYFELFKILAEYGADIHVDNELPLRMSCNKGNIEIVRYIINDGANIHINNEYCLTIATSYEQYDIVALLLENGANLHVGDDICLRTAVKGSCSKTLQYLIDYNADISKISKDELLICIKEFNPKIIKLLIDKGVDFSIVNNIKYEHTYNVKETIETLVNNGVDPIQLSYILAVP